MQEALDFQVEAQCGFWVRELGVVELDELVDHCEAALHASFRYVRQPDSVLIYEREPFGEHLHQVLDKMLKCSDDLVLAIAEARPEAWSDWDDDPFFNEGITPTSEMSSAWAEMERTCVTRPDS